MREFKNEQESQRWDCEQEEPQLEARRDEPLLRRWRSERYQLDETAREDVRRADRDNRTDDDATTSNSFQGSPAVIDDQHTDQSDRRGDDTPDDSRLRRQVERVVPHDVTTVPTRPARA
jgi:hypothetical protein